MNRSSECTAPEIHAVTAWHEALNDGDVECATLYPDIAETLRASNLDEPRRPD